MTISKHLLTPGTVTVLGGPSSAGKSFLALDLALHVALGRDWHGEKVASGGVLFVPFERFYPQRMAAFEERYGKDRSTGVPFYAATDMRSVKIQTREGQLKLARHLVHFRKEMARSQPALVVLDNLSCALNPVNRFDLLYAADLAEVLAERTGAAVLLVDTRGREDVEHTQELYGRADDVLFAEFADPPLEDRLNCFGGPAYCMYHGVERKLTWKAQAVGYSLDVVDLGLDEEGDPMTSCVIAFDGEEERT